ncbi:MAG: sugar phosphate isomerase/epimerase [Ruminococcaceae bacterium]|nr:sugar phosphate isomerase/epimerase [Oscillospiraceae bacterium]
MKKEYGIQMYSVRDMTETDLAGALKAVGRAGYKYVEFAGFFGKTPDEICRYMEDAGVGICGTHSDWHELESSRIDETIAFHKAIGNKIFTIPGAKLNKLERIDEFVKVVNPAREKLAANGISLAYHNHSAEFETMYWGTTIHTELERRTELDFQIDTYWAFNAGVDPIVLCERLRDRIKTIHLKDGFFGGIGKALGEGHAPVAKVIEMAERLGFYMIVESEGLDPTGIGEVTRCIEYLKNID